MKRLSRYAETAHHLVSQFGFLTPTALRLGLLAVHPGESKFLPKQISHIMVEVIKNTDAVEKRKSFKSGRREKEKLLDGRKKISFGQSRNTIKFYCRNLKTGVGKSRHRITGAIFQLAECVEYGLNPFTDLVSEFEVLHDVTMQSGLHGKPYPMRNYGHSSMALEKEPDGLINYRNNRGWYWIEVEGTGKNPDRREKIALALKMIGENMAYNGIGIVLVEDVTANGMILVHGFPQSLKLMGASLDERTDYYSIHQFLYLNERLGIDFFDFDRQVSWPNEYCDWTNVGKPQLSKEAYRREFSEKYFK